MGMADEKTEQELHAAMVRAIIEKDTYFTDPVCPADAVKALAGETTTLKDIARPDPFLVEQQRQAAALERIAAALERAYPVPVNPQQFAGQLGPTGQPIPLPVAFLPKPPTCGGGA